MDQKSLSLVICLSISMGILVLVTLCLIVQMYGLVYQNYLTNPNK